MDSLRLEQSTVDLDLDLDPTRITTFPLTLENNLLTRNLQKRYTTISIPSTYGRLHSSPQPGTVVGIVLGTVGCIVLVFYLTFLALNPGGLARGSTSSITDEEEVVVRSSRRAPSSSRRRSEVIEVVEERDRRDSYRRRPSRHAPDRVIVEESVTGTTTSGTGASERDNVVEVIEEESSGVSSASPAPPRRARSYRSGIRTVDPYEYGGGSSYGGRYR